MSALNESEPQETRVLVSLTEIQELRRLKLIQDTKTELVAWGKRWTTIVATVVSFMGLIGVNVVIFTVIRSAVESDIKLAQKAATDAADTAGKAKTEMDKATKSATDYAHQLKTMQDRAQEIDDHLKKLHASIPSLTSNMRAQADTLNENQQRRLESLESILSTMIAKLSSQDEVDKFMKGAEQISQEGAKNLADFQSNQAYTVEIAFVDKTNKDAIPINNALTKLGFRVPVLAEAIRVEELTGVPKGTLSNATRVVVVHDKGEEKKGNLVAKEIESVLGKGRVDIIEVPPSSTPKSIVVFLPGQGQK